jgi:hypothetical protein
MQIKPEMTDWFSTNIQYDGWGKAEFSSPEGSVEGPVKIMFDELGDPNIELTVESFSPNRNSPYDLAHLLGLGTKTKVGSINGMAFGAGNPKNSCISLQVKTETGIYHTLDNSVSYYANPFNPSPVIFIPTKSLFDANKHEEPKYWVLPLINFISTFSQYNPDLIPHPLRIQSVVRNPLIVFSTKGGQPGFIEPLQDYKVRKAKLVQGEESGLITALMIGKMGSSEFNINDLRGWVPFEFLGLLSLATGTEVGVSWVELRDERGELIQRIHHRYGHNTFFKGHRSIDEEINIGIGRLLTQAQKSQSLGKSYLRVSIRHLVRSGNEGLTLEDKLSYLFRGLDGLCNEFGFTKALNLSEVLSSECLTAVNTVITDADKSLRVISNNQKLVKGKTEKALIDRIANNLSRSKEVRKGFGKNVADLLNKFELPDSDIMVEWYRQNPRPDKRKKWEDVLSAYRGIIFHQGFLNLDEGGQDLWDVVRVINHLHDVLMRILFKILLYDGTYHPKVIGPLVDKSVDWVKTDTVASDLGYKSIY